MSLLKQMLDAGVHFGHQTKYWNPKMKPYIYGSRNKIHIINLDITVKQFEESVKFLKQTVKNGGTVLFVGTRTQAGEILSQEATRAGMPFVAKRWLGGMLTNFETVKQSIKKFKEKSELLEKSEESGFSKKELLKISREVEKLNNTIGGIADMKKLPNAIFVVDTGCHEIAIQEAKKLGIPVVGIVDTNNDPSGVDYVIPGNDDSAKAIELYASVIADAIIEAKESALNEIANSVKVEMVEEDADKKHGKIRKMKKSDEVESKPSEDDASDVAKEEVSATDNA